MYFDTNSKYDCSGCTACMNACPRSAITMHEDEEGFLYPEIDEDSCIHCNLCRKVCSWETPCYNNESKPQVFAAVLKDKAERQRSTSGGIFYAIAEWIISKNGVVYGAAFDNNLQLHHIGVDTIDDLQKLRGSKYIQSNMGCTYNEVKRQLENGRWCYFTGTGCQVAGLKAFLRKDYSNLITSDLVCHGVPSQKLFNEHITYLGKKYKDEVINYKFRDYKLGSVCESIYFTNRNPIENVSYELSPYLYSFMYGFTYRYSCYHCRFAHIPRQGDLSLADFWGVDVFLPKFDNSNGCSLLLLNSEKGKMIWGRIGGKCNYNASMVAEAARFNENLIRSSEEPAIRKTIFNKIAERGYANVAGKEFRSPNYLKTKFRNYMLQFGLVNKLRPIWYPVYHLLFRK